MDAYWKTLLQLAFPMYVIFLVVMVIFISEHYTKFARLVAKRNPAATLATLILLSYIVSTVILNCWPLTTIERNFGEKDIQGWPIDVMEMIIYFNIICFTVLTLKMETSKNQVVVAYTSIVITSALLLAVIVFHMYRYTSLFSTTKKD